MATAALLICVICGFGCTNTSTPPGSPEPLVRSCQGSEGRCRVLFIGNSLTYVNDVPAMVAAMADSAGVGPLLTESVVFGGYSLEDHWNQGDAVRAIGRGGWSVVVLQQGPSSLPESRLLLIEYARRFMFEIRRVGARPALYMVWPEADRLNAFDGVSRSYRDAAEIVDGLLFPAGEAWRAAWRLDAALPLYGPDQFHPSPMGSYLSAVVIFGGLYQRSPVGLPAILTVGSQGTRVELSSAQASLVQQAAAEAIGQFGRN